MKKIKTILLAVAAGLFINASAHAQQIQTREQKVATEQKKFTDKIKSKEYEERLALKEEQKQPFRDINKKYSEKMKAIKADEKGDKAERQKAATALQTDKDAEVKGLLTATQYKTYLDIKEEKKEAKKEKKEAKKEAKEEQAK